MKTPRIIPSITTHNRVGSTWREKIGEILPLKISELGLFVTGLQKAERKECYRLLCYVREQHFFTIPFVHAVSDMDDTEYEMLRTTFKTEWFNLHPLSEFPLKQPLSNVTKSRIVIENSCFVEPLLETDLDGFAGLCIDLAHLEDARLAAPDCYARNVEICQRFPVHANHISGVQSFSERFHKGRPAHSVHTVTGALELEYLKNSPGEAISPLAALELENTIEEQLRLIETVRAHLSLQDIDLAA